MSSSSVVKKDDSTPVPATDYDFGGMDTGLGDMDASDLKMPRINILHNEGLFQDNLTNEKFDAFTAVVLGLVKQRVLWPPEVGEEVDKPLCKSYNHTEGHPSDKFPWDKSVFDESQFTGEDATLPCESCKFAEWGSHPSRDTPWCSEQFTLVLMMPVKGEFVSPALLTMTRSAIKPTKAYLSSFFRSRTPAFTVVTEFQLKTSKRGSVTYSVPSISKVGETSPEDFPDFAEQYRSIRGFITTPPAPRSDDEDDLRSSPPKKEEAAPPPPADDDIPF